MNQMRPSFLGSAYSLGLTPSHCPMESNIWAFALNQRHIQSMIGDGLLIVFTAKYRYGNSDPYLWAEWSFLPNQF